MRHLKSLKIVVTLTLFATLCCVNKKAIASKNDANGFGLFAGVGNNGIAIYSLAEYDENQKKIRTVEHTEAVSTGLCVCKIFFWVVDY